MSGIMRLVLIRHGATTASRGAVKFELPVELDARLLIVAHGGWIRAGLALRLDSVANL